MLRNADLAGAAHEIIDWAPGEKSAAIGVDRSLSSTDNYAAHLVAHSFWTLTVSTLSTSSTSTVSTSGSSRRSPPDNSVLRARSLWHSFCILAVAEQI